MEVLSSTLTGLYRGCTRTWWSQIGTLSLVCSSFPLCRIFVDESREIFTVVVLPGPLGLLDRFNLFSFLWVLVCGTP